MSKFTDAAKAARDFVVSGKTSKEEFAGNLGGVSAPERSSDEQGQAAQQEAGSNAWSFDLNLPPRPAENTAGRTARPAANAAAAAATANTAVSETSPKTMAAESAAEKALVDSGLAPSIATGGDQRQPAAQDQQGAAPAIDQVASNSLAESSLATGYSPQTEQQVDEPIQQPAAATDQKETVRPDGSMQQLDLQDEVSSELEDDVIDREFMDSQIMNAGRVSKPGRTRSRSWMNRRFSNSRDSYLDRIKSVFSKMNKNKGMAFNGVLYADADLDPRCVSIGLDAAVDSALDPESGFIALVNERTQNAFGFTRSVDEYLEHADLLMKDVNDLSTTTFAIEVTTEKSPVNLRNSVQVRTLRIHHGGGIGLHPTQAKAFNADFDADQMVVNLDQNNIRHYNRAMDYLLDIEGNPAIDMDFFPIDPFEGSIGELKGMMKDWYFKKELLPLKGIDPEVLADEIAGEYYKLCDPHIDKDDQEFTDRVISLFKKIDKVAGRYQNNEIGWYRNAVSSYIFKELFDFSRVRRALSVRSQVEDIVANDVFLETGNPQDSPIVEVLVDYVNSVVAGRPAFNTVEFSEFMNRQMGSVEEKGRNIPFRMVADFCKAIHRTDLITIGDPAYGVIGLSKYKPEDPVPFDVLYGVTCAAAETKLLANRVYFGSHELSVSRRAREMVLYEMGRAYPETRGLPDYRGCATQDQIDAKFREWLELFVSVYNRNTRLLNMSQIEMRNGMTISSRKVAYGSGKKPLYDGINDIMDDIAKPLVEVYGDKTMGTILSYDYSKTSWKDESTDTQLWIAYRDMPLRVFMMRNRLRFTNKTGKEEIRKHIRNGQLNVSASRFTVRDAIMLVADRRTSQLGRFSSQWKDATEKNVKLLSELAKNRNSRDFNKYLEEVLGIFHIMSADMFSFFGIDSVDTFFNSEHGKRLIKLSSNGDVDGMRSELVSMTVEMHLHRASSILNGISAAEGSVAECSQENIDARRTVLQREYDKLMESSIVWSAIIKDVRNGAGNSTFRKLIDAKGLPENFSRNKQVGRLNASEFWASEESGKYATILTFLKSSEVGYKTKMDVLSDIVRINENMRDLTPDDMVGYLFADPDSVSDDSSFSLDVGVSRQLDNLKASIDRISSYRNSSIDDVNNECLDFVSAARSDKEKFEKWLGKMASDPGYAVYVPIEIAGDAISSVFEKNMHDTEKIQQQAQVNGLFEDVSIQLNGGFFTHLQQADNKVVNAVGYNQVTFLDLIKVLGDPSVELYIYDQFGTMMREPMCRRTLCGGESIEDVIDYLEANPRISCLLRRYIVGVNADVDGTSTMNRLQYNSDANMIGSTLAERVWSMVTDHSEFYAACSFFLDPGEDVGRNLSGRAADAIRWTCLNLLKIACSVNGNPELDENMMIDKEFGLSVEKIYDILSSNAIEGIGLSDADRESLMEDANAYYKMVHVELGRVLKLIGDSDIEFAGNAMEEILSDKNEIGFSPNITRLSIRACSDVLQQIGGSRTAKMLPVEGSETKRNFALKIWAREHIDAYGMALNPDGSRSPQRLPGGVLRDDTLTRGDVNQLTSIAKFLEVKREKAAETYNAKTKKYGNDGKNSIVKFLKYTKDSLAAGAKLRSAIAEISELRVADSSNREELREEAVRILAEALIKADKELGYTDIGSVFKESDYYNRADVMLGENSDGTFAIRTLEQISAALANRMPDDLIYADSSRENQSKQIEELNRIVRDLGTDRDPMYRDDASIAYDCLVNVPLKGSLSNIKRVDRALRTRSSSTERNYKMLQGVLGAYSRKCNNGYAYTAPSRRQIEARANAVHKEIAKRDKEYSDRIEGVGFPQNEYVIDDKTGKGSWKIGTDFSKTYDLISASWADMAQSDFVPGPQSMVVFDKSAHENLPLFRMCREFGVTVCFFNKPTDTEMSDQDKFEKDLVEIDTLNGPLWILPTFDMMLNGCASRPIAPAPAQWKANPNNYVVSVKDTTGEFGPSDAGYNACRELIDRVRFAFSSKKPEMFQVADLFKNVMAEVGGKARDYKVEFATREEIEYLVIPGNASVDIGVLKDSSEYTSAEKRYKTLLKEYSRRLESGDVDEEKSTITGTCRHNSIVGFVKISYMSDNEKHVCFAPLVPFTSERKGQRPNYFELIDPEYDVDEASFALNWVYSGSIYDQIIKIFEGIGASNKFMVSRNIARSRTLKNGLPVDGFYYHEAVASRLFSSNERIHTMISLWTIAKTDPEFSYNFAMLADAFPDNAELKNDLLENRLTALDWKNIVDTKTYKGRPLGRYYSDLDERGRKIDALVRHWVNKAVAFGTVNPSVLLCSRTSDALLPCWMTEFDAFLDSSYAFEDAFLSFFNLMQPKLCPGSIDGDSSNCLFKPEIRSGADGAKDPYGTLLCLVPHWLPGEEEPFDALEAVFISPSFFGEEYSDFKNQTIDSNNRFMDSLNVANDISPREQSLMLEAARASMTSIPDTAPGFMTMAEESLTDIASDIDESFPKMLDGIEHTVVGLGDLHKDVLHPKYKNVLAITGHRPRDLWGYVDNDDSLLSDPRYRKVFDDLIEYCEKNNVDAIVSGMAQGMDQIAALAAIEMKNRGYDIDLICAVPFYGQESSWVSGADLYIDILSEADKVYVTRDGGYSARKMQDRNEWMVSQADTVYALHIAGKDKGGTANCLDYAKRQNVQVYETDPNKIDKVGKASSSSK